MILNHHLSVAHSSGSHFFLSFYSFIVLHPVECWVSLCLSPWTANSWLGWTWARTSAVSSKWCWSLRTTCGNYRTSDAKTRSWVIQICTVSGLSYLSTFEVQCLVLGGLENIHCFLSKIFIHSVTTYCFYPIYVLEVSGLSVFFHWVAWCSLGHCLTSMKWYN